MLALNRENHTVKSEGAEYVPIDTITKKGQDSTGTEIDSRIFLKNKYPEISAIMFSYAKLNWFPTRGGFFLIHNPFAFNPLPIGLIKSCREYSVIDAEYSDDKQEILTAKIKWMDY